MVEPVRQSGMTHKYSDIRVGLIARMDKSGLGFQTKMLYDMLKPTKTLVIDSTPFNGREQHPVWYPDGIILSGFPDNRQFVRHLRDIDVLISCEIFYNHDIPRLCRARGIKTILQPNAELNDHFVRRIPKPDAFFMPSPWMEQETRGLGIRTYLVQPPVVAPRKEVDITKNRGELKVLHFGGRRAAHDRNGTDIVRKLTPIEGVEVFIHDQGETEIEDQRDLYEQGYHIVLIPRRYGGLCLPMLESFSYGLPVIMPNIEPNRQELPEEWLTQASPGINVRTKARVQTFNPDPQSIVWMLEKFRDMKQKEYNTEREKATQLYEKHLAQLGNWFTYIEEVVG